MNEKEFEELFGNTPFENIKKIQHYIDKNYIPVQIIEDFIKKYQKLSDEFYEKFLETNRADKDLHDVGLACDAKVQVLQELRGVSPEKLTGEAKKLFEAIIVIADGRDRAYKIIDLMAEFINKFDLDESICKDIKCNNDVTKQDCINCIKKYFFDTKKNIF